MLPSVRALFSQYTACVNIELIVLSLVMDKKNTGTVYKRLKFNRAMPAPLKEHPRRRADHHLAHARAVYYAIINRRSSVLDVYRACKINLFLLRTKSHQEHQVAG